MSSFPSSQSAQEQANGWARRLALAVIAIAGVSLTTFALGAWELASFGAGYVPMAPTTGLVLVVLARAIALRARNADRREPLEVPVLAAVSLAALATFGVAAVLGIDLRIERWLARTDALVGGVPVGRISVYTTLLLGAVSAGLLARYADRTRTSEIALELVALLGGLVILQGYLLGGQPLYGSSFIPVAASTSLCVVLLAASGLLVAGVERWPVRLLFVSQSAPPQRSSQRGFVVLASLAGFFVLSSGFFWHRAERMRAYERAEESLGAVAGLTAEQISVWFEGHLSTARAIAILPWDSAGVRRLASPSASPAALAGIRAWLERLRVQNGFESVALFATDGASIAAAPMDTPADSTGVRARLAALADSADVVVDDGWAPSNARVRFWIPMGADESAGARALAWLRVDLAVRSAVGPLLVPPPLSLATTVVQLWGRDGGDVVLIGPADEPSPGAPTGLVRLAILPESRSAAVAAGAGRTTVRHAVDYRGVPVAAAARNVSARPWLVVAKVERAQLAGPIIRAAVRATTLSLVAMLAVLTAIYALWVRGDRIRTARELQLVRDREASVEELRLNESRYRRAMRGTSDGLWDWDITTGALYVSPHWQEMLGVENLDLTNIQTGFFERIHPDDAPRVRERLDAHFATGAQYEIEIRILHADGHYRWFWTRGEAERDADGTPVRMAGAITDISARRSAEDALKKTDRLLRVRSAANLALVRARSEQELLQAVCDIAVELGGYRMSWFGYASDDAAKTVRPAAYAGHEAGYLTDQQITWNEHDPRGLGPTGRAIRSGEAQAAPHLSAEEEYGPWREAARARGYASSCAVPITHGERTIGALMLYSADSDAFDETELGLLKELGRDLSFGIGALRTRESLAEQQAQLALFRQVIQQSNDAIFIADARTGTFIDFNETAARQLGYTREELLALGPRDIAPEIGEAPSLPDVVASVPEEGGQVKRSSHRRKDGTSFPVDVALTAIEFQGRTLMLGIARDVTDRVRAEEERAHLERQLQQSQRLESVGRLAGGVAHDFNNLLTVINATADLAATDLPADSPLRRDFEQIRGAGDRAAALTRQLLALSRQQVMHRQTVVLNDVVSEFLKLLQRVIGEDIEIRPNLSPNLAAIDADPGQLEQVLMNICVNARDAMPGGGVLAISTQNVVVDEEYAARHTAMQPGPYVQLTIADTGEGMSDEVKNRIFEPFFTTKAPGKGTGLGLATVYGIVKQMGGSIWVYSEPGMGTTFKLYFPPIAATVRRDTPSSLAAVQRGTETILVVEDEEAIRRVAQRVLARAGYEVLVAASAADALTVVAEPGRTIHLVMTDIVMPGMSGIQLAEQLGREYPHIRILLATGYSADAVSGRFEGVAAWNLITKPYAVRDLLREVRRVLDA